MEQEEQSTQTIEFKNSKSFDLNDFEIFRAGKWNGIDYTNQDIEDMVTAFKEEGKALKPYLKLGHDDKQALLQSDGLPAAGWVTNLRNAGGRLLADFKNIPEKIYKLMESKRYGRVSSEIYHNYKNSTGKLYRRALKAVALLGGDTPAVGDMNDLIDTFYTEQHDYEKLIFAEEQDMSKEIEDTKKFAELEAELNKFKAEKEQLEKDKLAQAAELDKFKSDLEAEKLKQRQSDAERFAEDLVKDKKILPAQKESLIALCMGDGVNVYKFTKEDQTQEVKGTNLTLLKAFFSKYDDKFSVVDVNEYTKHVEKPEKADNYNDKLDLEIKKYCKENNLDYNKDFDQAFEAVAQTFTEVE